MVKLDNFKSLEFSEKKDNLQNLVGKKVQIMYDFTDISTIGPIIRTGKIISVDGYGKFKFQPDDTPETEEFWTIDGILELEEV